MQADPVLSGSILAWAAWEKLTVNLVRGKCNSVGVLAEMFQVLAAVENYPDSVFLGRVHQDCNKYNENSFSRLGIIVDSSDCRPWQQYRDVRPGGGRAGGRGGGRGPQHPSKGRIVYLKCVCALI